MATIDLTTVASVPLGTTLTVTVIENDGEAQATQSIADGTNTYTLTGFKGGGRDYHLDIAQDTGTAAPDPTPVLIDATVATTPAYVDLAGNAVGTGTAAGDASVTWGMRADAAGVGTATGSVSGTFGLAGDAVGAGAATGDTSVTWGLQGNAAATGIASGTLSTPEDLAGGATASGAATGGMSVDWAMQGDATGVGTATGTLPVEWALGGDITARGIAAASLTVFDPPVDMRWEGAGTSLAGVSSFGVGYRPEVEAADTSYLIVLERPQSREQARQRERERLVLTDQDFESLRATRRHTAIGDFVVDVPGRQDLRNWVGSDARVYYEGELVFFGRYEDYEYTDSSHITRLSGYGLGTKLKDGQVYTEYEDIPVVDAIRDYWDQHTRFDATVHDPEVSTVFENQRLANVRTHQDFQDAFQVNKTDPLDIRGDRLGLLQTCFFMDAPSDAVSWGNDRDGQTDGTSIRTIDGQHYNGGSGVQLTNIGDYVEFEFSPEYTMPHIRVGVRIAGQDEPEVTGYLNGQRIGTAIEAMGEHFPEPEWVEIRQFGENLQSIGGDRGETYTLRLEVTALDPVYTGGFAAVDVAAPYDLRFGYDWPVAPEDSGYLRGPQLYPPSYSIRASELETEANIESARIESEWNDISGRQELALSNNEGKSFEPGRNTTALDADFASYGYTVTPRFTFSRFGQRDDTGPTTGFRGQVLHDWTVHATGTDLSIISGRDLSDTHLENLQELHDKAGMRFTVHHDPALLQATSYTPNESALQREFPIGREEWEDYTESSEMIYSRVVVEGRRREDGSRRVVERLDREAIEAAGGDPDNPDDPTGKRTYKLADPRLATMDDVRSTASRLMAEVTGAGADEGETSGKITGTIDGPPQMIEPGYPYAVPEWDRTLPLDAVKYSDGPTGTSGTYDFDEDDGLAGRLARLEAESRTWRDMI